MTILSKFQAAIILAVIPTGVLAQEVDYGKASFERNCSVCHGLTGAGDGAVADLFAQRPRDLRKLEEENNGAFPFSEVYQSINGRRDIRGHGDSEMPIWGDVFVVDAFPQTMHPGVTAEEIVQGRILSLVYYLQAIQE